MAPGPNLVATSDAPPRGDLAGWRRGRPGETLGGHFFVLTTLRSVVKREHHKPVPLPPEVVEAIDDPSVDTTPPAELLERLDAALRLLPAAERNAVLAAHADDRGVELVAERLDISPEDAEALTRSAVQLLRGALADLDENGPPDYATVARRRSAAKRPAD